MPASSVSEQTAPETSGDDITNIARKVIPTMARFNVPMSPENYRVWYEYMIGSNESLSKEMNDYQESGAPFSDQVNKDLYNKYFGQVAERKMLEEVSQRTYEILKESMEKVTAAGSDTQAYSSRLNSFVARLEEDASDSSGLKNIIQEIVTETRAMEQSSAELQKQLETAKEESDQLRQTLDEVRREATRDVLTGLFNRKHMEMKFHELSEAYKNEGVDFSVIMMDIDFFKTINDNYGHKVGDAVLAFIGKTISDAVKGRDVPARYGGEEFIILLPQTTCENACRLAENLCNEIANKNIKITKTQQKIGPVTISVGVAQIKPEDIGNNYVIERADKALYLAKHSGRNNVKSENDLVLK